MTNTLAGALRISAQRHTRRGGTHTRIVGGDAGADFWGANYKWDEGAWGR